MVWTDSVVIGLTLAVDPDFVTLFIVIIFHRWSFLLLHDRRRD